ncbi:MAG: serine/threonine protein kinase [Gammaproteobacteria bacterium]|nr:serine/threonine protein kinase [Gammaproteobacteria bacterium]MCH9743706.1 serine/threonine protein kinase [Gammaproteobacteria bacterium]
MDEAVLEINTTNIEIGTVLKDRFVLEELAGEGGMGTVFKARDLRKSEMQDSDPYVALKILSEDFKKHPNALISLQRETRKAQYVSHPNIVPVYDFDRDGDIVFMTMEYLYGITLDQIIKDPLLHPLSQEAVFKIIADIGSVLAFAHSKGIIHSDVKPSNIFWTREHEVKVIDFGIARAMKYRKLQFDDIDVLSPDELKAHTPAYASYEMLNGEDATETDDIYGLACIAYELLAHKHPYAKQSAKDAFEKKRIPKRIPNLTKTQWGSLQRALSIHSGNRFISAAEFIHGLKQKSKTKQRLLFGLLCLFAGTGLFALVDFLTGHLFFR